MVNGGIFADTSVLFHCSYAFILVTFLVTLPDTLGVCCRLSLSLLERQVRAVARLCQDRNLMPLIHCRCVVDWFTVAVLLTDSLSLCCWLIHCRCVVGLYACCTMFIATRSSVCMVSSPSQYIYDKVLFELLLPHTQISLRVWGVRNFTPWDVFCIHMFAYGVISLNALPDSGKLSGLNRSVNCWLLLCHCFPILNGWLRIWGHFICPIWACVTEFNNKIIIIIKLILMIIIALKIYRNTMPLLLPHIHVR